MSPKFNLFRVAGLKTVAVFALMMMICSGAFAAPATHGHRAIQHSHRAVCTGSSGHIFIETPCGSYVDVTTTLTVINGQSYVTVLGVQIPVVINYNTNLVYNLNNSVIGYVGK